MSDEKKPKTNAERQQAYRERKKRPINPETGRVKVPEMRKRVDVWIKDDTAITLRALGILYGTANMGLTLEKVLEDLDKRIRQNQDMRKRWDDALDKVLDG